MKGDRTSGGGKTTGGGGGGGKSGGTKGVTRTGTEGADILAGGDGNDTLYGYGGNDTLYGYGGNDYLIGGDGDDLLDGGSNYDQMDGGAGNDTYVVDHINDFIVERFDGGTDTVVSSISYTLSPEVENLILAGGNAIDGTGSWRDNQLTGNSASNRLDGREGNDLIDGKAGADFLTGGLGADTFAFTTLITGGGNIDHVLDFEAGTDKIALDDAIFAGLTPGALDPAAFVVGTEAADADDRIIYDPATGALSFDADGLGGADAVTLAMLQPALSLSAADFIIF